jgi:hypothetical protein
LVVLALAIILLIIFAILSTYLSFPPLVAVAQGMKLILSGLQSFSCVRLMAGLSTDNEGVLSGVQWPQIMLSAFEFMNTFTFSFDSLRPECSIDFSARTKLILITLGPVLIVCGVLVLTGFIVLWKVYRIVATIKNSNLLSHEGAMTNGLFRSVWYCFTVSLFSLKYSRDNQVRYGPLWPSLDPGLIDRSDISVIQATALRRAEILKNDDIVRMLEKDQRQVRNFRKLPQAWRKMMRDFGEAGVSKFMSQATSSARLMISSALSIFIFTYQGVLETILSTWDCKDIDGRTFLRYRPDIECTISENPLYLDMTIISSVGLALYTFFMPMCVILVMRSRWAREIYAFNYLAYDQLFGFITSQYCTAFVSWEAVNCIRKMAVVAIPQVLTSSPINQSILNILLFFTYAMIIIACRPMVSAFLNTIEVLNSFNIIVASFAALLFTIQYQNVYVLQENSREIVGVVLIVFISSVFLLAVRLIYVEFDRLYALHQNSYLSKWLRVIIARAGGSILLDKYLPVSLLLFNRTSSLAIQHETDAIETNRKRLFSKIGKAWFSSSVVAAVIGHLVLAWTKSKLRWHELVRSSTYVVDESLANESMNEADYKFFVWMHKLLQRSLAWKPREKELRNTAFVDLPKMFTVNFGESDPPIAVCDCLLRTSRAVDEILNEDHKNLLLAFLLQGDQMNTRSNLEHGKSSHYQEQMREMIESFKMKLVLHVEASETFRKAAEYEEELADCAPLRRKLYGSMQSDNVNVLRLISNTSLRQYRELEQTMAVPTAQHTSSAEHIAVTQSDSRRPSRASAMRGRQSSTASSLNYTSAEEDQQPLGKVREVAKSNSSKPSPTARAGVVPQRRRGIEYRDSVELQEIVIGRHESVRGKSNTQSDTLSDGVVSRPLAAEPEIRASSKSHKGVNGITSSRPALAVPASKASAALDVHSGFVEKLDPKTGRAYWVNLKTGASSWNPPDAGHAPDKSSGATAYAPKHRDTTGNVSSVDLHGAVRARSGINVSSEPPAQAIRYTNTEFQHGGVHSAGHGTLQLDAHRRSPGHLQDSLQIGGSDAGSGKKGLKIPPAKSRLAVLSARSLAPPHPPPAFFEEELQPPPIFDENSFN